LASPNDHIVVITQEGCPPCDMLKMYIEQKDVKCVMLEVHTDISLEAVEKIWPECEGFPFVTVNGAFIGDLMFYLESGL